VRHGVRLACPIVRYHPDRTSRAPLRRGGDTRPDHPPEALPPTAEAATVYRDLAATNPAHLPGLAMALNNLGGCYSGLGHPPEALPPTAEAATGP
jgi:hypothetical protein